MARNRMVRPEFFLHEGLFDAEQESGLPLRLCYVGLWTQSDRRGRFQWRPRTLKAAIAPYDEGLDFGAVLDALEASGFIESYEVDGQRYGWIPSFERNQSVNYREAESTLPPPPVPDASATIEPPDTDPENDASGTRGSRVEHASGTRQARERANRIVSNRNVKNGSTRAPSLLQQPSEEMLRDDKALLQWTERAIKARYLPDVLASYENVFGAAAAATAPGAKNPGGLFVSIVQAAKETGKWQFSDEAEDRGHRRLKAARFGQDDRPRGTGATVADACRDLVQEVQDAS